MSANASKVVAPRLAQHPLRTRAVAATFVWMVAAFLASADAARFDFDATGGRLPKDVRPEHYRLELALDPTAPRFTGVVDIDVEVVRPVDAIVLNAHGLTTTAAPRLLDPSGAERALAVIADEGQQQWRLATSPVTTFAAGR